MSHLDLRKIIGSKSKRLAKLLPGFVYNWLNKLLHIEELNDVIETGWNYTPQEFLHAFFKRQDITYPPTGLEELDPNGRYIFAANHPFGGMDGMMIADLMINKFGDGRVVVNDILLNLKPLVPIWIPVNTLGRQNSEYAKKFEEELAGDLPILTFPAGMCSRWIDGEVQDLKWKNTFVRRAQSSGRTIVPVFVTGSLHNGFYRLYRWRKRLGLKANLEMMLLVDGMFRQKGRELKVIVGDPISPEELLSFGDANEQCAEVRKRVYALRG